MHDAHAVCGKGRFRSVMHWFRVLFLGESQFFSQALPAKTRFRILRHRPVRQLRAPAFPLGMTAHRSIALSAARFHASNYHPNSLPNSSNRQAFEHCIGHSNTHAFLSRVPTAGSAARICRQDKNNTECPADARHSVGNLRNVTTLLEVCSHYVGVDRLHVQDEKMAVTKRIDDDVDGVAAVKACSSRAPAGC